MTTTSNKIDFSVSEESIQRAFRAMQQNMQQREMMRSPQGLTVAPAMFENWQQNRDLAQKTVAVAELPIPETEEFAVSETQPSDEYRARAKRLGIQTPALLEAELQAVLESEHIRIYNYERVFAFLQNLCDQENQKQTNKSIWDRVRAEWCWKPLRAQDRSTTISRAIPTVYAQYVPGPVLEDVELIQNRLPEAKFFVSEIVRVKDPFLAVTVEGSEKLWVIARWDEPSFRDA